MLTSTLAKTDRQTINPDAPEGTLFYIQLMGDRNYQNIPMDTPIVECYACDADEAEFLTLQWLGDVTSQYQGYEIAQIWQPEPDPDETEPTEQQRDAMPLSKPVLRYAQNRGLRGIIVVGKQKSSNVIYLDRTVWGE